MIRLTCSCSSAARAPPRLEPRRENDESAHHLSPIGVRQPDDRRLLHGRVLDERVLHLLRPNAVAGRADDVVVAAKVEEVAVRIGVHRVAGDEPPFAVGLHELRCAAFGILPVAEHELGIGRPDDQPAAGVPGVEAIVSIEHRRVDARERAPHRARLDGHSRVIEHGHQGLGLPVAVQHFDSRQTSPRIDDLRVDGLARGHRESQRGQIEAGRVFEHEPAKLGGGGAKHGHPVALQEFETAARVEGPVVKEHRRTQAPRPEVDARSRLRPAGIGGAPHGVPGAQREPVPGRHPPRMQRPRTMQHTLGRAGRAPTCST